MVVSIDANKVFYVGTNKIVGDSAMILALRPILEKESPENRTVVINADKTVPLEYVVGVMRIARELGARSVLAVDRNAQ